LADGVTLASLLSPTTVQSFLNTVWAKSPFLAKSDQRERFGGLLNLAEFEFLLSSVAAPGWLSFVSGVVRPPSREQLTRDGTLDVAAIYKAVADNQSLLLTKVHRLHSGTGTLCRRLAADFRSAGVVLRKPIRANAYYTPPRSQGFDPHYDDHDVLVLQLHGEKRWRIYGEAVKWPRKPMLDALDKEFLRSKAQELTLLPGDVLYIPRGFVHEAKAWDTSSLHLTFSVDVATWGDVFQKLVDLEDRLGEPLPVGFCSGGMPQASDKAHLAGMGAGIARWPGLNQAMADVFNTTFIEGDLPPNGYLARMDMDIKAGPDAWLALADGVFASLELEANAAVLRLPGAALRAEKQAAPLFRNLCEGKPFRICDLENVPDASALAELAQELLKRGVLVVLPEVRR
jgi:lysine-specific demethylase/histidyl-hydroxylase NO66